jgi:hypothetical protein
MPQIVAIFLLVDSIRRINIVLKDETNVLCNYQAMILHLFTFCLYGVTLSWLMISGSLFFISFFVNPTTETVTYYFVVVSQFVSVLLLLYIFNGLVTKERDKSEPVISEVQTYFYDEHDEENKSDEGDSSST